MHLSSRFHPATWLKQKLDQLVIFLFGKPGGQHQLSSIQASFDTVTACRERLSLQGEAPDLAQCVNDT